MSLSIAQTIEVLTVAHACEDSVMLYGVTSTGKSAAVKEYGLSVGMFVKDFRLSQTDVGELLGIPFVGEDKRMYYAAPEWWPTNKKDSKGNEIPDSAAPIILFLDEINRARPDLINSAFELALEHSIGGRKLPKGSLVVSACNPAEDGYSTNELDMAFMTRFLNFETVLTHDEFRTFLNKKGNGSPVTDFLAKDPSALNDCGFCTMPKMKAVPRGWEKVDKGFNVLKSISSTARTAYILAAVGQDRGVQFLSFCENCDVLTGEELRKCKTGKAISKMKEMVKEHHLDMVNVTLAQFLDLITATENSYEQNDYEILIKLCDTIPRDLVLNLVNQISGNTNSQKNHTKYSLDTRLNKEMAKVIQKK